MEIIANKQFDHGPGKPYYPVMKTHLCRVQKHDTIQNVIGFRYFTNMNTKQMENETQDCRSEEGITVGLIDSLISISRVLAKRKLSGNNVQEALADLADDEDMDFIMKAVRKTRRQ